MQVNRCFQIRHVMWKNYSIWILLSLFVLIQKEHNDLLAFFCVIQFGRMGFALQSEILQL